MAELFAIADVPGREHFEWMIETLHASAAPVEPTELLRHLAPRQPQNGADSVLWASRAAKTMNNRPPATDIRGVGWRSLRNGIEVVQAAVDGKVYDFRGRYDSSQDVLVVEGVWLTPSTGSIDVIVQPLSDDDSILAAMRAVFLRSYDDPDPVWFDSRVARFTEVALAWEGDQLVGFNGRGGGVGDFGPLGQRVYADVGLSCVDPDARGRSLMHNMIFHPALPGQEEIVPVAFASPASVRMQTKGGQFAWPTIDPSLEQLAADLRGPTPVQRAVGRAAAKVLGAVDFDEDHWVGVWPAGHGRANADLGDIEPALAELFGHVDQAAGRALVIPLILPEVDLPPGWDAVGGA